MALKGPTVHVSGRPLRALIVDDEPGLSEALTAAFRFQGWQASAVGNGVSALASVKQLPPDVVILDIGLPDIDGFAVLERLRSLHRDIGVIFLTARDAVEDRVAGIRQGGDDYLTKPFSLEEVLVRAEALARRIGLTQQAHAERLVVDDLMIDTASFEVERDGRRINLTATEFALARYLAENVRRVCSKRELLREVWGDEFTGAEHIVELYISYLRRKIDQDGPSLIHTVRGVGYVMRPTHS